MDTLFRLVNLQSEQSFNSSTRTTSSGSRSSSIQNNYHNCHQQNQEDQEQGCFNCFMDEDDFSSSSSKHYPNPYQTHRPSTTGTTTTTSITYTNISTTSTAPPLFHQTLEPNDFSFPPIHNLNFDLSGKWESEILLETAHAIAEKNGSRVQQLLWMLNELSSPYGSVEEKLAYYFFQALFSRATDTGDRCYRTLTAASDKNCSFDSTRKMVLKFQEVSPWTTFGHVACNGAILEALDGESKIHIIDISNTYCTQWPTFLEALATRMDDAPHLRLTTVVVSKDYGGGTGAGTVGVQKVMKEIGHRMEKFARLMGVPFKFNAVHHVGGLSQLNISELGLQEDETLAVNCVGTLHSTAPVARDNIISMFHGFHPRIITVVEEEADLDIGVDGHEFIRGFQESLQYFRVYFESLDDCFPRTSNERLMLERAAGRAIMDLIACPLHESVERRESAVRWSRRLYSFGFSPSSFSDEVCDDVRALLRRYKEGWSMKPCSDAGMFLSWKDQPVVWASAWRP